MAIFETTGSLHLRLADSEPVFECGDGVSATYHRTVEAPSEAAPYGVETVTIVSPAGHLHYDEADGVHTLTMGDAPVIDGALTPEIVGIFGGENG